MKSVVFFLFMLACAAGFCQSAQGVSKPVVFGNQAPLVRSAEGVSNTVHFTNLANRDNASGRSNPVLFGSATAAAAPAPVTRTTNNPAVASAPREPEEPINFDAVPNYYALIIGVSDYAHANATFQNLDRPAKDASALARTLKEKYAFPEANIKVLLNASRAQIIESLETLASKITAKDNLLVFYAGHGFWDENLKVGYWLPADALPDKKHSWIANSSVKDYIGGIPSKHTLLITDACFSGSIFKTRGDNNLSPYGMAKLYQLSSRKAMTSGNLKTVPDQSKFFDYLNKRLSENTDRFITARQLFNSLYTAVLNNTNTVPLYGVIQDTGDEGGEFVFVAK
jgi:hypothetical protein